MCASKGHRTLIGSIQRGIDYTRGIYYGWTMLFAVAVAQITTWGVLYYSFTVFLEPMNREFGWSIATLTGAYSLALLISGLAAIPVGRWLDRNGPRGLMTAGSIFGTLLVIAWATVDNVAVYYLIWIGIGLTMAAVLYEPAFVIVATWFDRLRSRALTLLTFVAGLASVIYVPLAGWLVATYGWRSALLIMAALLALGTIPIHAFMLRRRPEDIGLAPDGGPQSASDGSAARRRIAPSMTLRDALRDRPFWWTSIAFVLANFTMLAIFVHLIPHLTREGYSAGFAATMVGLTGALALPGRLIFTPLGERIQRRYVAALIFGLQAGALLVLLLTDSRLGVFVFVVLFGTGFGAVTPARAAIIADLYGSANYGAISGALAMGVTFARAAAPVTAGAIFTLTDSYTPVFVMLLGASSLAVLAVLRAR
jgi:MFS family permease